MLRIEPTGHHAAGNTTVLLNAHYDSTLGSPGKVEQFQGLLTNLDAFMTLAYGC